MLDRHKDCHLSCCVLVGQGTRIGRLGELALDKPLDQLADREPALLGQSLYLGSEAERKPSLQLPPASSRHPCLHAVSRAESEARYLLIC